MSGVGVGETSGNGNDSSESETENNDDLGTSVKFLLLVKADLHQSMEY
jgi:hypothetical protein